MKKIILINFFLVFIFFFILETYLRTFKVINFNGIDKNFLIKKLNGNVENNKNFQGIVFGNLAYTDENGFRIPKNFYYNKKSKNILILGDSNVFGPGVDEEKTFVGLIRRSYIDYNVYNSAVIGYNLNNYYEITQNFLKSNKIEKLVLFFDLNDIDFKTYPLENEVVNFEGNFNVNLFKKINFFLRDKSLLYVYIKGLFTNPPKRYYEALEEIYNKNNLLKADELLRKLTLMSKSNKFNLVIFVYPYSYQVSNKCLEKYLFPQKEILNLLNNNKVLNTDLTKNFCEKEANDLYLKFDPVHLSEHGHNFVFNLIKNKI